MKKLIILLVMTVFSNSVICYAQKKPEFKTVLQGQWGTKDDELGMRVPYGSEMPSVPYDCVGGFTIDSDGCLWIVDSVNRKIKKFTKGKFSKAYKVDNDQIGDIVLFNNHIFVVTSSGVQIIDAKNGKVISRVNIKMKSPGRIHVMNLNKFVVEDSGNGIWLVENNKAAKHPSTVLEAVGVANNLFGTQYNLEPNNRLIVSCDLTKRLEQPRPLYLYEEPEKTRILYSRLAGIFKNKPVLIAMLSTDVKKYSCFLVEKGRSHLSKMDLPVLEQPFMQVPWKMEADGYLYAFTGTPKGGWKIIRILAQFS